ncbi:hypothetical protein [Enterovirga rhinocerotis]|uniref:Uncharacterized protein n=1 Tax=Enterovirga rhinocerotis TaxID=1339210 RepID=A0A4R7BIX6_9HYPH|nr:hypothetical protein [Enterovirga rhinocerotis]TDR85274.1 hypothetical protein EV668_4825 [Enterovirga rhinocerotis]
MRPRRRPRLATRRGTDAYRQGDLCGVYAVVNVVGALCPELDEDNARSLFRKLVRALASNVDKPMGAACFGVDGQPRPSSAR